MHYLQTEIIRLLFKPILMRCFFILLFIAGCVNAQTSNTENYSDSWGFFGPDDKPQSPNKISACGIGPIEFIRISEKNPDHLLAGSLSGGLFTSEDGGESWVNAGSDRWEYSGCGWADFYPGDDKIWFAYSNISDNNGKPGNVGPLGGILRSSDQGTSWEMIAPMQTLGSEFVAVYGFRFLPSAPNVMFALTNDGLLYTENCLAENVTWIKYEGIGGVVYDMNFIGETAYVSAQQFGKWNVFEFDFAQKKQTALSPIADLKDDKRVITFEPIGDTLLVLIDYSKLNDELWSYLPADGSFKKLLSGLQVNFGSGHTFAVNPHNQQELLLGNSTTLKRFMYPQLKERKLASGYHVDVEFTAYHPTDTNRLFVACHGGIYRSDDGGASWVSKSVGLGVAEVMGMAVSETDANIVVIGTFHDGSSVHADFEKNGAAHWRTVNGGDALTPLIHATDPAIIYTSTQFTGGGIYHSADTGQTPKNVHNLNSLSTSGWEFTAVLHPIEPNLLFFNYTRVDEEGNGNIDVVRTAAPADKKSTVVISDFGKHFNMESYKVYGLYNNRFFPDHLYAYILHYDKNENGEKVTRHRLFRTEMARDSADVVKASWYELEVPESDWIGDVEGDPVNPNAVYVTYTSSGDTETPHGLIYQIRYNKKTKGVKQFTDITANIPPGIAGRFNLVCRNAGSPQLFFATRTGVYMATKKTMKGKSGWVQVGNGLPHCKVYGLHYQEKEQVLTVGYLGRGVWRYWF